MTFDPAATILGYACARQERDRYRMVSPLAFERSTGQAGRRAGASRDWPGECQPAKAALVSIRLNPVPAGLTSGVLRARDGIGLRYATSIPQGICRGTVVLMLGRADFI